ncbi:hypothetical protein HYC85_028802 [Camellia sinensis]|uniref:Uncharacterized protein n=1 Tax=Camellia sinensis TaxID=4442 RepID=A0A7J7FXC0_CAMSI|nr:hypothetical protein HYC85_028802 [Camellia sinensis]
MRQEKRTTVSTRTQRCQPRPNCQQHKNLPLSAQHSNIVGKKTTLTTKLLVNSHKRRGPTTNTQSKRQRSGTTNSNNTKPCSKQNTYMRQKNFKLFIYISTHHPYFYYCDPLYDGFGVSAMWAVLTIVVVFDFSVGATLGRGVNRGFATLLASTLGVGAHRIASFSGEICEPILLGLFRLHTSCSISGYRDDEVLEMAHRRLSTILIGGASAVIVCVCICPYVVLVLSRASSHLSIRQIMVGPILWHMVRTFSEDYNDLNVEPSFGETNLDFEGRERSTKESTPILLLFI